MDTRYSIRLERGDHNWWELDPNYRKHYAETTARLEKEGIKVSPYNPRLDQYFRAFREGWLLNFVARFEGKPVGHCNVYITNDMHNGDLIAQEDMLYVVPEHRKGLGRELTKAVLKELQARDVKRAYITTPTDPRVSHLCRRLGFKDLAQQLVYSF